MSSNLKAKDYRKIFFLYGVVYATIPIIITEIIWDIIFAGIGFKVGLLRDIVESFFRAALIEESFKFFGFMKASKNYHFSSEKEFMLGAGMIGLSYAIIEKLASGNAMAIILGVIFPMHILWQMNQGIHYFKYIKAKEEGNNTKAKKELFMATAFIFLMHGCWDALISLVSFFADNGGNSYSDIIGGILFVLIIIIGILYIFISLSKIRKVLKNSKE